MDKVEKFKDRKGVTELTQWQKNLLPNIYEAMLGSRDRFMVEQVLRQCTAAEGSKAGGSKGKTTKIVLVVGMAHMDGIERIFHDDFGIEKQNLGGEG